MSGWRYLLFVSLVAAGGCGGSGGSQAPLDGGSSQSADASGPADESGPRPLPPSEVALELDQFPQRANAACIDNTNSISVEVGGSISAALANAPAGTTVWVEPGTYTENADEATALSWTTSNVCLRAAGGGQVVLLAASGQKYGISPSGDDLVIEGFTVRGFEAAIGFDNQSRITIERVRVDGMVGDFRDGIIAYGPVDGLLLFDVEVEDADLSVSCNTGPCAHWWIERTTLRGRSTGSGNSGADAFAIEAGRQIVLVEVTVDGATADGIDTKADDVVVFGARVYNVERNAIKFWHGGELINSVIDGSGADASLIGDQAGRYRYLHVLVTNHDPSGTGYVGTWGYDNRGPGFQIEIINSLFVDNARGGFFVPSGADLSIRRNLFDGNGKLIDIGSNTTFQQTELVAFEAAGFGQENRIADPLLRDVTAHDYSTESNSPARDAGEVIEGLDIDLAGGPRVVGPLPDIGPVESR